MPEVYRKVFEGGMFVLTKKENGYGESAMACPGVMEKVDRLFPEGFYLLPSSVHECLITRKGGGMDLKGGGVRGWCMRSTGRRWSHRRSCQTTSMSMTGRGGASGWHRGNWIKRRGWSDEKSMLPERTDAADSE